MWFEILKKSTTSVTTNPIMNSITLTSTNLLTTTPPSTKISTTFQTTDTTEGMTTKYEPKLTSVLVNEDTTSYENIFTSVESFHKSVQASSEEIQNNITNTENKNISEEVNVDDDNEDKDADFNGMLSQKTMEIKNSFKATTTPLIFINLKKQKVYGQASNENENESPISLTPIKEPSTNEILAAKKSPLTFNVVLYIISGLLCLSVIINAGFFYFTRCRRNRGKLILNHDLSDSCEQQNMKSNEIADTN